MDTLKAAPMCQVCMRMPGTYKVMLAPGKGFRWKCEPCFLRKRPEGYNHDTKKD